MTSEPSQKYPITYAFCTYNRAERLPRLVAEMRAQHSDVPFEILAVNNNSKDNTIEVLTRLQAEPGAPLRFVTEQVQGIVAARNRAIAESLASNIMIFIDDDELPKPGLVQSAYEAIAQDGAQCVGGKVEMDFSEHPRPTWLTDDLLGFLAAIDYGEDAFWVKERNTPFWTANIAYDMQIFRDEPELRFDQRYDRQGNVVGGGSDAVMFRALLARKLRIKYAPGMSVLHNVEPWRLHRRYFLALHYRSGLRKGHYELPEYPTRLLGAPRFLYSQLVSHAIRTGVMAVSGNRGTLRQAMNVTHTAGLISGYRKRSGVAAHGE